MNLDAIRKKCELLDEKFIDDVNTMTASNTKAFKIIEGLLRVIEMQSEALKFYADIKNWSVDYVREEENGFRTRTIMYGDLEEINDSTGHSGRRAREALNIIYSELDKIAEG